MASFISVSPVWYSINLLPSLQSAITYHVINILEALFCIDGRIVFAINLVDLLYDVCLYCSTITIRSDGHCRLSISKLYITWATLSVPLGVIFDWWEITYTFSPRHQLMWRIYLQEACLSSNFSNHLCVRIIVHPNGSKNLLGIISSVITSVQNGCINLCYTNLKNYQYKHFC